MALACAVLGTSPASNPDRIKVLVTFSGNYGVNGVGDPLNLAPYDEINNPGGMTNPGNIPLPAIPSGLIVPPGVSDQNLGGAYVQVSPNPPSGETNGVQTTIAAKDGFALRVFAAGGAELATNAAYGAGETGGSVVLDLQLPQNQ